MSKTLRNYKLSCVGLDSDGQPARLVFFVYGVEGVENARRIVRKDKIRRRLMRQQNIDWDSVELRAVRCNGQGEVADSDTPQELDVMMAENKDIDDLLRIHKMRSWLTGEDTDGENL